MSPLLGEFAESSILNHTWYISQIEISGPVSKWVFETGLSHAKKRNPSAEDAFPQTETELASWFKLERKTD